METPVLHEQEDVVGTAPPRTLFDLSDIPLTQRLLDRRGIERVIPHRGDMAFLDWIVWLSPDLKQGLALKHIREGEFWSRGRPAGEGRFGGALMIEAGAQLACFLFNSRSETRPNAAFLRLEDTSIWREPCAGEDLFLLCSEIKYSRRRFVSEIQGVVAGNVAFTGRISGMAI